MLRVFFFAEQKEVPNRLHFGNAIGVTARHRRQENVKHVWKKIPRSEPWTMENCLSALDCLERIEQTDNRYIRWIPRSSQDAAHKLCNDAAQFWPCLAINHQSDLTLSHPILMDKCKTSLQSITTCLWGNLSGKQGRRKEIPIQKRRRSSQLFLPCPFSWLWHELFFSWQRQTVEQR